MADIVNTIESARELAARIMAARERPLVVVSTAFGSDETEFDLTRVEAELGAVAEVVLLHTGEASRVVDELLPDKLQVFGGAGRSYPVDIGRDPDIRRSPLRFPAAHPERATELLVSDALAQAYAAGAFRTPRPVAANATGTVIGVTAGRALVRLDRGGMASIWHELTWPEVPFEWTVRTGLAVTGSLDTTSGRFEVARPAVSAADLERSFPHRSVTLALVEEVGERSAVLALHPDHRIRISRTDVSAYERDVLRLLLTEGDVVAARVLHLQGGALHLQLLDVEDEEPVAPALALLPGGDPWLREDRSAHELEGEPEPVTGPVPLPAEDGLVMLAASPVLEVTDSSSRASAPDAAPASAAAGAASVDDIASPAPGTPEYRTALQSTQLALVAARQRIEALDRRLVEVGADDSRLSRLETDARVQRHIAQQVKVELADALSEAAALKAQLSEVRRELRVRARARVVPDAAGTSRAQRRDRWASDEEWLRHEIYLAWVERVDASDRGAWPLPGDYRVSDRLADSLAMLDDPLFVKALKAMVDVVTGRVREIPGRELHPLRRGEAGNAPAHVRGDGARCFRVYVEQKVPAARRLHFWQLPDGTVELERVVSHDVVEP